MNFTPLIDLGPTIEDNLRLYIRDELIRHNAERGTWVERVKTNNIVYRSKPSQAGMPNGMSNIIVPLGAISVEAIHASEMITLFGLNQFVTCKLPDEWADIDRSLETILDHEMLHVANIYNTADISLLDKAIHGVGVAKSGWVEEVRKAIRYKNGEEQVFTVTSKRGPTTDSVAPENFLMPFSAVDINQADWCGELHIVSPYRFKCMVESDIFRKKAWDDVVRWIVRGPGGQLDPSINVRQQQEDSEERSPTWPEEISWYEIWLGWDVDDDGKLEEIVVHYHHDADSILGIRYNYSPDLRKPYHHVRHFPVSHRWLGIGVIEQVEQMQHEVSVIHRQRIDAGNLANLPMLKIRRLSTISVDEPVYPGKKWFLDDMNDVEPIKIGEIYNSAYQNESQVVLYAQQRTGVNELNLGMPQVGTPGTAASDLARVQEGKKRFDYVFNEARNFVTNLVMDCVSNISQFGTSTILLFDYVPNGERVKEFLALPVELLRQRVIMDLKLAGQHQNKIVDRASWTQLAGMLTQYWTNMMQMAQGTQNPEMSQMFVHRAMTSATEAMKQILESFDARNIDKIIAPDSILRKLLNAGRPPIPDSTGISQGSNNIIQFPGAGFVNPINTTVGG